MRKPAANLGWQCEDQMEILYGQQVFGPRRHPVARCRPLAFGTVPVLAAVICDVAVPTFGAGRHMPAERLGSAGLNGRHDLESREVQMPCIGLPISRPMIAKDVSNF